MRTVPTLLWLLSGFALASAQEPQMERVPSPANPGAVLFSRDRELMHPGDPLVVVGLEQEGNDFRDRAPALRKSEREPLLVDEDENYRRRLAMYEEGSSFRSPLALAPGTSQPAAAAASRRTPLSSTTDAGGDWLNWLCVPAMLLFGGLMYLWYRQRQAFQARRPAKS
jgi:hypothetical protein